MQADWTPLIGDLQIKLDRQRQVSMSVGEIVAATHCHDPSLRERWFWRASQLGAKGFENFTDAGLRLRFFPDARRHDVETVTFYR